MLVGDGFPRDSPIVTNLRGRSHRAMGFEGIGARRASRVQNPAALGDCLARVRDKRRSCADGKSNTTYARVPASFTGSGISHRAFPAAVSPPTPRHHLPPPAEELPRDVQSPRIVEKLNTDWKLVFLTRRDRVNVARNFHNSSQCLPGARGEFPLARESNSYPRDRS